MFLENGGKMACRHGLVFPVAWRQMTDCFVSSDAAAVAAGFIRGHGQTERWRCSTNTTRKRRGATRSTTSKEIVKKERGRVLDRWRRTHESKKGKNIFSASIYVIYWQWRPNNCLHARYCHASPISVNVLCCQCHTSGKTTKENRTKKNFQNCRNNASN